MENLWDQLGCAIHVSVTITIMLADFQQMLDET